MGSRISQIVRAYRAEQALTLREMANALKDQLRETRFANLSAQAVGLWEKGTNPFPVFLLRVSRTYADWRRDFALDCLAAMEPDLYEPTGAIGREILGVATTLSITNSE